MLGVNVMPTDRPVHLSVVPNGAEPWEKLPKESPQAYGAFLAWLMSKRPRERPHPEDSSDSPHASKWPQRHDWLDRARQYDQHRETPPDVSGRLKSAIGGLTEVLHLEVTKLLRAARSGSMAAMSTRELIALMQLFIEGRREGSPLFADGEFENLDMNKLTDEEFRDLQKIWKKVKQ